MFRHDDGRGRIATRRGCCSGRHRRVLRAGPDGPLFPPRALPPPSMATILCVDDDVAIGAILGDTLERIGHRAEIVRSVPEALLVLARGGVDAIISDYRMPAISGIEFLSILASEDHDIPLIMLTGHASI